MWKIKLEEIIKEKNLYNEQINLGASEVELVKFKKSIKEELQKDLPSEYCNVLKKVNGLEFNGFILYGIDEVFLEKKPNQKIHGLISNNQIWYENEDQEKYLFIGESNISWYVYDTNNERYIELDNPSGREMVVFKELYEMLDKILSDSLL